MAKLVIGEACWTRHGFATMIKQPNVAVLRKLLARTRVKHPEPFELVGLAIIIGH